MLLVHSSAERYGSDRSLVSLVRGLAGRGWAVTATVPDDGPLVPDLVAAGATVVQADPGALRRVYSAAAWLRFGLRLPAVTLRFRRLARRHDLVHVNTSVSIGAALGARLAGRPLVLHVRESYAGARAWRWYGWLLGRLASAVVANSASIGEEIAAVVPAGRVHVIENGLSFGPRPSAGVTGGDCVLTVGRINGWKGQDVVVRAIAELGAGGLQVPLVLAGDVYPGGEAHREALEDLITTEGVDDRVRIVGFVEDVASLHQHARVFVLATTRPEPFGLALVEAMGAGLACVASDAGGPREIVRHGETGLLVPPGDEHALAAAIARLWSDDGLRERLGEAAADDVRRRFPVERTIDRIEALYRTLGTT